MRVLVIGSGGREHALAWKLSKSPHVRELYCAPGNGGIAGVATCVPIKPENTMELAKFASEVGVDLTVVGPELPLSLGIAEIFRKMGLRVFGPSADSAQLETSKIFAKQFMTRHHVPTAAYRICASYSEAEEAIDGAGFGWPLVIKADGLAAGKGVVIARDREEAIAAAKAMMQDRAFGPAGDRILIEQCLSGPEVSFMVVCDGERFLPLFPACDYKRAFDDDQGPNTGGMGAYSPSAMVDHITYLRILTDVVGPSVSGMIEDGRPFIGLLYCGLMLTKEGPKVLEYNVRFGDPETQVVLPLLENDLFEILFAAADGRMRNIAPLRRAGWSVTVVLASGGYPGSYETGKPIGGLEEAGQVEGVTVFHAGTKEENGTILTAGGRVLNVTAVADTLEQAIFRAYQGVERIRFDGARYRTDIAHNAVTRKA